MFGVKAVLYDSEFDRYRIFYHRKAAEKVWANGGWLKVEGV